MEADSGFKLFTHDLCSPLQGGAPVWDGRTPFELPKVVLDTSYADCAPGWHYSPSLADAARIARLWSDGWSSRIFAVEPLGQVVHRKNKSRAESLLIIAELDQAAVEVELRKQTCWGGHGDRMAAEQAAWWHALSRPRRNVRDVERGLRLALRPRDLGDWKLRRFDTAWDARAARDARDARDAWDAWAARDAWAAWAAWDARDAWAAWDARDARDAWDAWAAWAAWDERDAWDALTVAYAGLAGWVEYDPMLLTTGIRDSFEAGLLFTIPTGPKELGWVMARPVAEGYLKL